MTGTPRHRSDYLEALRLLGRACAWPRRPGTPPPVLVGGAVVEHDTGGAVCSGDFDFCAADEEAFAAGLAAQGFVRGDGLSLRTGAFWHPSSVLGVELVSGAYFDGNGDMARVRRIAVPGGEVAMAATEDLVADRLGQWVASGRRDAAMLGQALAMLGARDGLDRDYLEARIRQDCAGEVLLPDVEAMAARLEGGADIPRNSGNRRTGTKKALLGKLRQEGARRGAPPPFKADF